MNATFSGDAGPVKYGDTIALRCVSTDTYVGVGEGDRVGAGRKNAAAADRWLLSPPPPRAATGVPLRSCERGVLVSGSVVRPLGLDRDGVPSVSGAGEAAQWHIVAGGGPFTPEWAATRCGGGGVVRGGGGGGPSLAALGPRAQEAALVDDLLYALLGLDGAVVRARGEGPRVEFVLDGSAGVAPPLAALTSALCPVATAAARCGHWVAARSREECGLVAQALCAGARLLLREFSLLVAQVRRARSSSRSSASSSCSSSSSISSSTARTNTAARRSSSPARGVGAG